MSAPLPGLLVSLRLTDTTHDNINQQSVNIHLCNPSQQTAGITSALYLEITRIKHKSYIRAEVKCHSNTMY